MQFDDTTILVFLIVAFILGCAGSMAIGIAIAQLRHIRGLEQHIVDLTDAYYLGDDDDGDDDFRDQEDRPLIPVEKLDLPTGGKRK